jgi:uncharacterized protein
MILDVGPLLRGEKNRITFDYTLAPIPMDRVQFNDDAHVTGEITNSAGYMQLKAEAHLAYETECARCLDTVSGDFVLDFERVVADEGTLTEEQIEDNVDEYVIVENGKLDIDEQLAEALLLDFPRKVLCSEDCPGLCPKCGKSLKGGDCGCPKKEIDPRLAVLATLLQKEDEE